MTAAPLTSTEATPLSEDSAVYVTPSPSKRPEAITSCVSPSLIVAASMLPTAAGAGGTGGTTVTAKDCSALPAVFVAVTVTVALPAPTAVTVTAAPLTSTAATPSSEDSART